MRLARDGKSAGRESSFEPFSCEPAPMRMNKLFYFGSFAILALGCGTTSVGALGNGPDGGSGSDAGVLGSNSGTNDSGTNSGNPNVGTCNGASATSIAGTWNIIGSGAASSNSTL